MFAAFFTCVGFRDALIPELAWAVVISVVAGVIGASRIWSARGGRSGADVIYGLTAVWAPSHGSSSRAPHTGRSS